MPVFPIHFRVPSYGHLTCNRSVTRERSGAVAGSATCDGLDGMEGNALIYREIWGCTLTSGRPGYFIGAMSGFV